jgi:hypothetical protein
MSDTFKKAFLICTGLAAAIALFAFLSSDTYRAANAGIWLILFGVLYFFLGLILLIPVQTRKAGQAMLLSAITIFVIGVSVCSTAPSGGFH